MPTGSTMQGPCDKRPQGRDRINLAKALVMQHDFVNASYIYASLGLAGLNAQQLLLAGEAHFRAGLATKSGICFRDAVRVFRHTLKTHGATADKCRWLARS